MAQDETNIKNEMKEKIIMCILFLFLIFLNIVLLKFTPPIQEINHNDYSRKK